MAPRSPWHFELTPLHLGLIRYRSEGFAFLVLKSSTTLLRQSKLKLFAIDG
jgi:hypothetical protein